jgi:hypothetical protein
MQIVLDNKHEPSNGFCVPEELAGIGIEWNLDGGYGHAQTEDATTATELTRMAVVVLPTLFRYLL